MRSFLFRLLLDPTAETAGNGTGTGQVDPPAAKTGDAAEAYKVALAKHENDHAAMARTLHGENATLRSELDALKAKVPGEGAVVLNKADAGRWAELGKLGTVDEIKGKLTAGADAVSGLAKIERANLIGAAAEAHGFDRDVLTTLVGTLAIEVKEETRGGKKVKVAEVVTREADDKGVEAEKRTALDKFAGDNWAKFLPSLKAGTSAAPRVGGTPSRTTQARPAPGAGARQADAEGGPPRLRSAF